jgi:hypothetical protein
MKINEGNVLVIDSRNKARISVWYGAKIFGAMNTDRISLPFELGILLRQLAAVCDWLEVFRLHHDDHSSALVTGAHPATPFA